MQQLKLNGQNIQPKKGFWKRQFDEESTNSQKRFDWIFGVSLPAICFFFDPIVFESQTLGKAFLGNYKPFAYVLCYLSLFAMSLWLGLGGKLKWLNAFFGGLFLVGGIVSLIVGVILIPFSLLGLVLVVGVLGFTPLFTSIVYLRNSVRAFRAAKPFVENKKLIASYSAAAILGLIIPLTINIQIRKNLQQIVNGDIEDVYSNAQTLRFFAPIVNFDLLEMHYYRGIKSENAENAEKMQAITEIYHNLTGKDINKELMRFD